MGEVINLNRARKARAKAVRDEAAAQNRTRFGRTRAERDGETARKSQDAKHLDGHRLDDDSGIPPEPPKAG